MIAVGWCYQRARPGITSTPNVKGTVAGNPRIAIVSKAILIPNFFTKGNFALPDLATSRPTSLPLAII